MRVVLSRNFERRLDARHLERDIGSPALGQLRDDLRKGLRAHIDDPGSPQRRRAGQCVAAGVSHHDVAGPAQLHQLLHQVAHESRTDDDHVVTEPDVGQLDRVGRAGHRLQQCCSSGTSPAGRQLRAGTDTSSAKPRPVVHTATAGPY
jgi:hypothetical protein